MKKVAGIMLLTALLVTGCGAKGNSATAPQNTDTKTPPPAATAASGKIAISGSTSTEKIVKALADEYTALHPNVKITYEGIGSSAGVKNAIDGVSDIGTVSREVKAEEKASGLTENIFAYDGIAAITHPSNKVADLTVDQLKAIYMGEITNWKEVGGADQKIVLVAREEGSGTRAAFEEILGLKSISQGANIAEGNGNVQTTVAGNPQAIGYVSFTYINDTVKACKIAGVAPTAADVLNHTYALSRPFVMVYFADKASATTKDFINFADSADGQKIIEEGGGIVKK